MGDIVRKQGRNIYTEGRRKELIAFLEQQNIARFKLPERLEVVPEFPLSPMGKILKRQLREMIVARLEAQGAQVSGA